MYISETTRHIFMFSIDSIQTETGLNYETSIQREKNTSKTYVLQKSGSLTKMDMESTPKQKTNKKTQEKKTQKRIHSHLTFSRFQRS